MINTEIDSIIFDLDGTLWDPTDTIVDSWNSVLVNYPSIQNLITRDDLKSVFGTQHDLIGKKLFPYLDDIQLEEIMNKCFSQENTTIAKLGGQLYTNLEKVLKELYKKYRLYIVSNCQSGYIEAFYKYHKLEKYFLDYECSGNTGKSKGENIKLIISRNSMKTPIYIGDTQGDYEATRVNSIPFVYADYGFGKIVASEYRISSIEGILDLLS